MKMMRDYAILLLFFISLFSCSGNKKPTVVTSEAIEGYWVSGYLLHNTELSRTIASDNSKKPKVLFLRLKNEVNGFADTSYRIHGDTLLYRLGIKRSFKEDVFVEEEEFYPFRITFHSKERLVLMDDVTHEETTFYNLSILPAQPDAFNEIIFKDKELIINDSIKFYGSMGCTQEVHLLLRMPTNSTWKNNLDTIVSRINWEDAGFVQNATLVKDFKRPPLKEGEIFLPFPIGALDLNLKTKKHFGYWRFPSAHVSDPALTILIEEMKIFEEYCYKKNILRIYL